MGLFKIIGGIFLIIVLIAAATIYYFYNYHSFKTLRVCVSDKTTDLKTNCTSDFECIDVVETSINELNFSEDLPEPLKEGFDEIIEEAVYCEGTCKMKEVYGFDEELKSCKEGEKEFTFEITGKQGLKIIKGIKEDVEEVV